MKKVIIFLLFVCCCLPLVSAQEVKFSNLNGQKFSFKELTASPRTIILAWTAWCPYCRRELERLAKKCKFFKDSEIFFVNIGEKKSIVKKFIDSKGIKDCVRDKVILDPQQLIAREFNVVGIPAYLFFKDGRFLEKTNFLNQEVVEEIYGY